MDLVKSVWSTNIRTSNSATRVSSKFKLLRAALKKWSKKLSNLSKLIKVSNNTLEVLDTLEEQRPLFLQEYNFRRILKAHILRLLGYKKEYWKKDTRLDGQSWEMKEQNSFMLLPLKDTESTLLLV
jgi:hypothetical protein